MELKNVKAGLKANWKKIALIGGRCMSDCNWYGHIEEQTWGDFERQASKKH